MNTAVFFKELPAELDRLPELLAFLEERLEEAEASPRARMQLAIAAEEIFVNIAHYAYAPKTGMARVELALSSDPAKATLRFLDRGTPFDPLRKPDPDVSLSAEERAIGGLGIYMTKKTMDEVKYDYIDGQNVLTLIKKIQ